MDFVVLGFGIGALAVLVGLGVRDLGPMLRRVPRSDRDDLAWSEVARRVAWGRACRAAGLFVTLAGAGLCLLTLLALVAGASDGVGMILVVLAVLVAIVGLGAWAAVYRQGQGPIVPGRGAGPRGGVNDRRNRAGRTTRGDDPPALAGVGEKGATNRPPGRAGVSGNRAGASGRGKPERPRPAPSALDEATTAPARSPREGSDPRREREAPGPAPANAAMPGRVERDA